MWRAAAAQRRRRGSGRRVRPGHRPHWPGPECAPVPMMRLQQRAIEERRVRASEFVCRALRVSSLVVRRRVRRAVAVAGRRLGAPRDARRRGRVRWALGGERIPCGTRHDNAEVALVPDETTTKCLPRLSRWLGWRREAVRPHRGCNDLRPREGAVADLSMTAHWPHSRSSSARCTLASVRGRLCRPPPSRGVLTAGPASADATPTNRLSERGSPSV